MGQLNREGVGMIKRLLVLILFTLIGNELSACFREGCDRKARARIAACFRAGSSRQERKELYASLSKAGRVLYSCLNRRTRRYQRQDARAFKRDRFYDDTRPDSVVGPDDDVWVWTDAHDTTEVSQSNDHQSHPILGRYISVHSMNYLERPE